MTFAPTALGEALVGGYRAMGLQNLWLPDLRSKIEANIDAVARGTRNKVSERHCYACLGPCMKLIHGLMKCTALRV